MTRVTLDTNIHVSALNGGYRGLRLLHMAIDGDIEIAISEPTMKSRLHRTHVRRQEAPWARRAQA